MDSENCLDCYINRVVNELISPECFRDDPLNLSEERRAYIKELKEASQKGLKEFMTFIDEHAGIISPIFYEHSFSMPVQLLDEIKEDVERLLKSVELDFFNS